MSNQEHSWVKGKAATLKDVAKAANVSESTASVVLNNSRSGTRVSDETRQNVAKVAKSLGYRANGLARSLQTGLSNRLGLYTDSGTLDSRNMFFAELLGGMLEGSIEHSMNTLIHTSGSSPRHLLDLVSNQTIDGLVVHAGQDSPIQPLLNELRVPAVAVVDRVMGLPSVCVDDSSGGKLQAHHLHSLGHRHVILKSADWPFASAVERQQSFVQFAEELGMTVTQSPAKFIMERPMLAPLDLELLTAKDHPATAFVAWNDSVAEAICRDIDELGFSIPGQVAVVGYDGFQSSYLRKFEITTIRAPWAEVGQVAVSLLMSLLRGDSVPDMTVLPVAFVRGSTS